MDIKAFKMDGLGNDFVIIDNRSNQIHLSNEQIVKICNREFIGCDQLIIIKDNSETDASVEFFNSDGSPSGACGNGTRCVADLLSKEKKKDSITVTTESGNLNSKILGNNMVTTQIGVARTEWHEIPLSKNLDTKNLNIKILDSDNKEFFGGMAINVGNPHLIFFIKNLEKFNIEKIGSQLEVHEFFPEKCNVTIAEVVNKNLIKEVKIFDVYQGENIPEDKNQRTTWTFSQRAMLELTHNWGTETDKNFKHHNGNSKPQGFGHIGFSVPNVYEASNRFEKLGVIFQKKPSEGRMSHIAFIKDPDGYWIEIVQSKKVANIVKEMGKI